MNRNTMQKTQQKGAKTLSDILQDGLFFDETTEGVFKNMSHISLNSALKSYFKTADDLSEIVRMENAGIEAKKINVRILLSDYVIDVCDTILHLQHFFELYVKNILLTVSPLLVYKVKELYDIELKLIKGISVSDSDLEKLYFIEGSEAFNKLKKLITKSEFSNYAFLNKHFELIEQVNTLRNRIAHRGAFVLSYKALDELFGKKVLPFLEDMRNYDKSTKFDYGFNLQTQSLNPFEEIKKEFKKTDPNRIKIYVLKMIGYAAFNNRIAPSDASSLERSFYQHTIDEVEEHAQHICEQYPEVKEIKECPVCGCKTLQLITETDGCQNGEGDIVQENFWIDAIECEQCGFYLHGSEFIESSQNGIPEINSLVSTKN